MRVLLVFLMIMGLMTGQAFATKMYMGWCGGISTAFTPGNRGIIVPLADGPIKSEVPEVDQMALQAANSKGINYRWSLGAGIDSSMSPDKIAAELTGKADFFVVLKEKPEPVVEGEFEDAQLSYQAGEDWEYIIRKTNHKGNLIRDEHYTVPMASYTAYVDVPGFSYHYEPVLTEMYVYDGTGRLIYTDWAENIWADRAENIRKGMEKCFGNIKDYRNERGWCKVSGDDKAKVENINCWKAADFKFDKKDTIAVPPVVISATAYQGMEAVPNYVLRNIWGNALEERINTTHQDKGKYRLEVDFTTYNSGYYRQEPYIATWTDKETIENRDIIHDKIYHDSYEIYRYIRKGEGRQGSVGHHVDCLGMVFRLYDTATDKLAFSYSSTTKGTNTGAGVALIVENFFKKLNN